MLCLFARNRTHLPSSGDRPLNLVILSRRSVAFAVTLASRFWRRIRACRWEGVSSTGTEISGSPASAISTILGGCLVLGVADLEDFLTGRGRWMEDQTVSSIIALSLSRVITLALVMVANKHWTNCI